MAASPAAAHRPWSGRTSDADHALVAAARAGDSAAFERLFRKHQAAVYRVCLGVFGNVLRVHVGFSVPRLRLDTIDELIGWLREGRGELRYALVVFTKFQVRHSQVAGYLVLVLNMAAFDRLVSEIDNWVAEEGRV